MEHEDGLTPIGEMLGELPVPLKPAKPQAVHHFTQADQVNQLVSASEADPDLGFMARMMALCSLPRTNPGNRHQYKRVNGPYKLILSRTGEYKLPFGNLPRLLIAWICTEAVRTQNRELVLGRSLSKFMRTLDVLSSDSGGTTGVRTRLRNQAQNQSSRHGPPSGGPDFKRPSNRAPATRVGVSKSLLGRCLCGFEASRTRRASTTSARRDRARPGVVSCSRFSSGATRNGEMRRQIGW